MKNEFDRSLANLRAIGKHLDTLRYIRMRAKGGTRDIVAEEEFYRGIASKMAFDKEERIKTELKKENNSPEMVKGLIKAYGKFVEQEQTMGLVKAGTSADYDELGRLHDIAEKSYNKGDLGLSYRSLEKAIQILDSDMDNIISLRKEARMVGSENPEDKEYLERLFEKLNEGLAEDIDWNIKLRGLQGKVQSEVKKRRLGRLISRQRNGTKAIAGTLAALAIFGGGLYYLTGGNLSSIIHKPKPAVVQPIDYSPRVIIANGIGNDHSSEKDQIESLKNAFESYRLFPNAELFISNPYNLPIPEGVKVAGIATKENIINAIRESHGNTSIFFLSPQRMYSVGSAGTKVESDACFYTPDGAIYPREMVSATANNRSDLIVTNVPNWEFVDGMFAYQAHTVGDFKAVRPKDLTAIMLKEDTNMAQVRKRLDNNPRITIESLFAPYIKRGMYVNQYEQPVKVSQSPIYRAPLSLEDSKD